MTLRESFGNWVRTFGKPKEGGEMEKSLASQAEQTFGRQKDRIKALVQKWKVIGKRNLGRHHHQRDPDGDSVESRFLKAHSSGSSMC